MSALWFFLFTSELHSERAGGEHVTKQLYVQEVGAHFYAVDINKYASTVQSSPICHTYIQY